MPKIRRTKSGKAKTTEKETLKDKAIKSRLERLAKEQRDLTRL